MSKAYEFEGMIVPEWDAKSEYLEKTYSKDDLTKLLHHICDRRWGGDDQDLLENLIKAGADVDSSTLCEALFEGIDDTCNDKHDAFLAIQSVITMFYLKAISIDDIQKQYDRIEDAYGGDGVHYLQRYIGFSDHLVANGLKVTKWY